MATTVNKIRNPDFSRGRHKPTGWLWSETSPGAQWQRRPDGPPGTGGMTITTPKSTGAAVWSQVLVCKPNEFYRVEATVTCRLATARWGGAENGAGVVITIEPLVNDRPTGDRRVTPGIRQADEPMAVRAYYQPAKGIRRLRLSVGVVAARGRACIHHVRFIPILEPDETSHPMALPVPPHALPAPRVAAKVCVCSETGAERPLTRLLAEYFGESNVSTGCPTTGPAAGKPIPHAIFLPDATPPRSIRSLTGLAKLAADRIVVISLPAFARLTRGRLSLRRVEQEDDPIHARVTYANHATCGFALHDTFAYAWPGRTIGSFVQNHFRRTAALKAFCERHGFVTLLTSMCDRNVTSDRPICLYRQTSGGSLVVLDIEPVEAAGTSFDEPTLAMHLLLSILGHPQNNLGQFVSPVRSETELRQLIRDMADRFEHFVVHERAGPPQEGAGQLVTIRSLPAGLTASDLAQAGGREQAGAPARGGVDSGSPCGSRPVLLVRSGLLPGDVESVYGVLLWFKQLVRQGPHRCPYASELTSAYGLAWVPLVARWETRDGWRRSRTVTPGAPLERVCKTGVGLAPWLPGVAGSRTDVGWAPPAESERAVQRRTRLDRLAAQPHARYLGQGANPGREGVAPGIAVLIDVISCPTETVRVVLPKRYGVYRGYRAWLPRLAEALPACASSHADRPSGRAGCELQVVVAPQAFAGGLAEKVIGTGGRVIRIEIPGSDADFPAHSISRTGLTAATLEHVIGLEYGLLAVNRTSSAVALDAFPPAARLSHFGE